MENGIDAGKGFEQLTNETAIKVVDQPVKSEESVVVEKPIENIKPLSDDEIAPLNDENDKKPVEDIKPLEEDEEVREINADDLAEKLTGFSMEDPKIVDFLVEENKRIAEKYKLPVLEKMFTAPNEYDEQLDNILSENEIKRLSETETAHFFEENPLVAAAYFPEVNGIGKNLKLKDNPNYDVTEYYVERAHEIIHGLQHISNPNMKIEQMEYEAYIACIPIGFLNEKGLLNGDFGKGLIKRIFNGISNSINVYEDQLLKKRVAFEKKVVDNKI